MRINAVHQIDLAECSRCHSIMFKGLISFHLTRCLG